MKAKKLLALLLSIVIIMNFSACADKSNNSSEEDSKKTAAEITNEKNDNNEEVETESDKTDDIKPDNADTDINTDDDEDDSSDGIKPLLYKVTDEKGNVIWLFGSIHVGKDYFYPLPDYVTNAYDSADAVAVEFDVVAAESDYGGMVGAMMPMAYMDGSGISDHIPQELYNDAKAVLSDCNLYYSALDTFRPVMWSTFIDSCLVEKLGYDPYLGIDYHILNTAHDDGKKVYDIESMEFQFGMLADFSDDLQILLLEESVNSYKNAEEYKKSMEELVDAWAKGNEKEFATILSEEGDFDSAEERALYKEYNDAMVVERNISMTDYAENALKSDEEVFICVGAAHIVGEGAMADLLAERGYTVEIVK